MALALLALAVLDEPAAGGSGGDPAPRAGAAQARAAAELLAALGEESAARAVLPLSDARRRDWTYLPGRRPGVALREMTLAGREAAHRFLRGVTSPEGYLKLAGVLELEGILREVERFGLARDPGAYWLVFFGHPSPAALWSWRFEGHHLSLNFTATERGRLSVTPLFFGANPAEVASGARAGLRVLGREEDLARELLASLSEEQRAVAIVSREAPADLLTRHDPAARRLPELGLPASAMDAPQRERLLRLVELYAGNLESSLVAERLAELRAGGLARLRFAWAGSPERGAPHYYRVQGPTLLVEYDNTQNGANHVHCVWRDLADDFGGDALRAHYTASPHHGPLRLAAAASD